MHTATQRDNIFSNTYAAPEKLEPIFMSAINRNDIVALSIATRPDCLPPAVVEMPGDTCFCGTSPAFPSADERHLLLLRPLE